MPCECDDTRYVASGEDEARWDVMGIRMKMTRMEEVKSIRKQSES